MIIQENNIIFVHMNPTWTKEKIQVLKRTACSHREDPIIEEKLSEMNRHLSIYERTTFIRDKATEWREVERIATELHDKLDPQDASY